MSHAQRTALDTALHAHAPSTGATDPTTPQERRAGFAALMATMPVPEGTTTTHTTLGGRPALLLEHVDEWRTRPGTILYFHGGSWVVGSPDTAIGTAASLTARTGIRVFSLDYRLAPEHPFPAGIEDGVSAYRELLETGHDPRSIAFAGDSAGGGLSVTSALLARDLGLPVPGAILAFSGGFDATRTGASMDTKAGIDPFLSRESMASMSGWYLDGADPAQLLLSPAVTGDLAGLPPMLLQVGTNEVLLDDSTRLAARARDAEVDVVLDVTAGVPHVFQTYWDRLDEADHALERAALWLAQHLA
jgi:epsilon-lactone hydrolase